MAAAGSGGPGTPRGGGGGVTMERTQSQNTDISVPESGVGVLTAKVSLLRFPLLPLFSLPFLLDLLWAWPCRRAPSCCLLAASHSQVIVTVAHGLPTRLPARLAAAAGAAHPQQRLPAAAAPGRRGGGRGPALRQLTAVRACPLLPPFAPGSERGCLALCQLPEVSSLPPGINRTLSHPPSTARLAALCPPYHSCLAGYARDLLALSFTQPTRLPALGMGARRCTDAPPAGAS